MAENSSQNKRTHHLRVPVSQSEKEAIEAKAKQAGLSVACYLREVGQGYPIGGIVDLEQVRELAKVNGDLGRLGGLLKLWLTNDERTAAFGKDIILALLRRIETNQNKLSDLMKTVVRARRK